MSGDSNTERESKVLELYNNQGKTTREIAKEQRLSLRDISLILKKHGVNHGIASIDDDNKKSHSNNEKATQAYKLFIEGRKPVDVAIQLSVSEKEVTKYYTEYWRLKGLYGLYHIYQESKRNLSYILKLCSLAKRQGITADNIEWFVDMVNIGTYNIPDLQKQYTKLQDEVLVIDYQKVVSKAELDYMNNQVSILHNTIYQLSTTCNDKRNEISYLQAQVQVLRDQINGLNSRNQQRQEIQNQSYT